MDPWVAVRRVSLLYPGVLCWASVACLWPVAAAAIDLKYETEFLTGLRSRGLYRLAVRHAEGILRTNGVPPSAQIDVAIDLSQTLADWANASPAAERDERREQAHAVLAEIRSRLQTHPRAPLLDLQDALLWYSEGDLAQEEAVLTASTPAMAIARQKLRQAINMLEGLTERVEESLRRKRRPGTRQNRVPGARRGAAPAARDDFSIDELTSLSHHIALVTAQALASQAETYAADSPDRVNALTRAVDQLASLLLRVGENDLRQRAELELISAHRLLRHYDDARRLLGGVLSRPEISAEAAAEDVRLLLAEGRTAEALAAVARHRSELPASPVLGLAHLEVLAAAALAKPSELDPREAIESATRILHELEQGPAPRLHRQGELWVARLLAATNEEASTIATARLAAEGLYRAGRLQEAIAAFDRAVELARGQQDAEAAYELALTAAAIVLQGGDAGEAARRYLELANAATPLRAAEAHRLAILATADAARGASTPTERDVLLVAYGRLLDEHLSRWPSGSTSDEVRIWSARWRLQSGDAAGAVDVVNEVRQESEHYAASRRLLADAYQEGAAAAEAPAEQAAIANEAAHALQPAITGSENRWPTAWSDLQRELALALARLQLVHADGGATYAQRLLTAALTSADAPPAWRHEALGLLLAAEAYLGHEAEVEALLAELATASPEVKAETIALLVGPRANLDATQRRVASGLALRILDGIGASAAASSHAVQGRLAHQRARALAAAGQHAAAIAAYRDIVARQPTDGDAFEEYAQALAASESPDDRRLALQTLQQIERRTMPGAARFMRSRLARIRLLAELGETAESRKLLKLTIALHPDLGGPTLRAEFEAVAALQSKQ